MVQAIEYIFFGTIHFLVIALEFIDYIEQALTIVLIVFFTIIAIWKREFFKMYFDIAKTFAKMIFSGFGFVLFMIMALYYCFTIFAFEEKINFIFIVITLCLFFKDLFEFMNNSILDENKKTITSILEVCESVFILCIYRLIYMIELKDFSQFNYLLYSLIFIPVIAFIMIIMKILTTVETLTIKFRKYEKLEDIEYLKLFLRVLLKVKSINGANKIINEFFTNNNNKTYEDSLNVLIVKKYNKWKTEKNNKIKKVKYRINIKSTWFVIWVANILTAIYMIIEKRFFNINFTFYYYWTLIILSIYFIIDLMKVYKIKCQYDFIVYLIISIVEFIILLMYHYRIQNGRLSNMLFLIFIYIIFAFLFRKNKMISFLDMPFLSKENFFGLPAKN